jgi:hypothetical protein
MRAFALILLGAVFSANAVAKDASGLFDKPVKTEKIPLPADPQNPQAKAAVSCSYFKGFAVKQIDRGEIGAELSIVPLGAAGAGGYKCREAAATGEIAVDAKEWSGYFKGVKGSYIFFDADDGHNGGVGFAIYSAPESKKLFEDTSKSWHSVELTPSGLTLRYMRAYDAGCSLYANPAGCWAKVRQATGITQASAPDCAAPYKAEEKRMKGTPNQAKVASLPSVVDYEAQTVLQGGQAQVSAAPGKAACRLSD